MPIELPEASLFGVRVCDASGVRAAALALAAAIHATLGSSWLELQTAGPVRGRAANERCVAQAGASLNDEATRLLAQTWQTGIPGDNGCALTAESAAIDVRPWTDISSCSLTHPTGRELTAGTAYTDGR